MLNFLINSFESDIVIADYRVRGFTRNVRGMKHYIDHQIDSIQNFIAKDIKDKYQMVDVCIYQEYIFHTKMRLKERWRTPIAGTHEESRRLLPAPGADRVQIPSRTCVNVSSSQRI